MRQKEEPIFSPQTLVEALAFNAEHMSNKVVYTFLADGESESAQFTFSELDTRARQIAARLQELDLAGERALLLFQPNLEYIAAFFGCLYAGVIAVPAYPPRNNRNLPRLQAIIEDADAKIAITSSSLIKKIQSMFSEVKELAQVVIEATDVNLDGYEEKWTRPNISSDYLAFLQYTSGSTGNPRGVMLSHGNLLHNLSVIQQGFNVDKDTVAVMWLPPYHDMGLIGGLLDACVYGAHVYYMPPAAFLQRPIRLLETISKYKANVSGGPNFTYDLLVNKTTPEQREGLDLSSWNVAFNGAEPIHWGTLEKFIQTFEPFGLKSNVLYPCYGLAEATLLVSGSEVGHEPVIAEYGYDHVTCIAPRPGGQEVLPDPWMSKKLIWVPRSYYLQDVTVANVRRLARLVRRAAKRRLFLHVWTHEWSLRTWKEMMLLEMLLRYAARRADILPVGSVAWG